MQINLLAPQTTSRQFKGTEDSTRTLVLVNGGVITLLVITLGVLFGLTYYTNSKIAETDTQINSLQSVSQQINERSKLLTMLTQKQTQYKDLEMKKSLWGEKLSELMKIQPQNLQLTSLSFGNNDGGKWELKGIAPSYGQLTQFGANLQNSAYFGSDIITEASQDPSSRVTFSITAKTKGGAKNE